MKNGGLKSKNKESSSGKMSQQTSASKLTNSITDNTELDNRIKKLEIALSKVTSQNEALIKRIDDLESRDSNDSNPKNLKKASSCKSLSTLNNTFTEIVDEFNVLSVSASRVTDQRNFNATSSFHNPAIELSDWKKDIEKSLECILEKISTRNSSNVLVELLEKRINDINNEFSKLKKVFDENIDNSNVIKRNLEKFDRSEKLINSLLTQIAEMKNNNLKWQTEFLKNINEFNEKLLAKENFMEHCENFEKKLEKEINNKFNKREEFEVKINEKIKKMDEQYLGLNSENYKLNKEFREEMVRIEFSNKALWDSFALLSSSMDYQLN